MEIYENFVTYTGEGAHAFDRALKILLPLGFRIETEQENQLVVVNRHYQDTRQQDALMGISRAEFIVDHSALTVRAELGGVEHIQRYLLFIMIGLGLFDVLLFTGLWYFIPKLHPHTWFLLIPLLALIPWALMAPRTNAWIRERTVTALHTLLTSMKIG